MSSITNLEIMFNLSKYNFSWDNDLIVIAGATAVGKSNIAVQLAKEIKGVIVNADSVQVYKDLSVLSARPDTKNMDYIPHYLYGYVNSSNTFSVSNWLFDLHEKLVEIKKNKKIPILVGGSGLYINAAINGLVPIPAISENIKQESLSKLDHIGIDKFREILFDIDPVFLQKNNDKQRLLRAHSVYLQTSKPLSFWYDQPREGRVSKQIYSFLISSERKVIYKNCDKRFNQMLNVGGLEEVIKLRDKHIDRSLPIMKSLGVKWFLNYLDSEMSFDEAVRLSMRDTRHYVKRQLTWFRHNYIPNKIIEL
ncbi:MAG: tRNA (adenosine(37)-N6)-dimethylallyltransferase MiaA [Candidatus Puniceispirillales bacterium]